MTEEEPVGVTTEEESIEALVEATLKTVVDRLINNNHLPYLYNYCTSSNASATPRKQFFGMTTRSVEELVCLFLCSSQGRCASWHRHVIS